MDKFFKILIFIFFSFLFLFTKVLALEEKIKIGLLVPLTGEDNEIGHEILQATRIALKDINSGKLEIYPKSHAAWTGGKQKLMDKGRISKFNKKFQNFKSNKKD